MENNEKLLIKMYEIGSIIVLWLSALDIISIVGSVLAGSGLLILQLAKAYKLYRETKRADESHKKEMSEIND